jgi:hypothetical protein
MQMKRKIGLRHKGSMEIDIINLIGDSLIKHRGICNCGVTAPLNLNFELDKK